MSKNIKSQMFYCIDDNVCFGSKKRTATEEERKEGIYSYQYRNNLKDVASNFSQYLKNSCDDVKMMTDIEESHIKGFLESKERDGLSPKSLETYRVELEKIGYLASKTYGSKIDMSCESYRPGEGSKIRNIAMSKEDYQKVIDATVGSTSQSRMAIETCREFGLRASEVVKIRGCDIEANKLHIEQSKGGRDRDIPITKESQREALNKLLEHGKDKERNEPLLTVKADSVNKYLKDNLEKNGITKYSDAKTGIHAIRKLYAQERYDEEIAKGLSHKEAWGNVSEELGHGRNREDLFHTYCPEK